MLPPLPKYLVCCCETVLGCALFWPSLTIFRLARLTTQLITNRSLFLPKAMDLTSTSCIPSIPKNLCWCTLWTTVQSRKEEWVNYCEGFEVCRFRKNFWCWGALRFMKIWRWVEPRTQEWNTLWQSAWHCTRLWISMERSRARHIIHVFNHFCLPFQLRVPSWLGLSVLFPALNTICDLERAKISSKEDEWICWYIHFHSTWQMIFSHFPMFANLSKCCRLPSVRRPLQKLTCCWQEWDETLTSQFYVPDRFLDHGGIAIWKRPKFIPKPLIWAGISTYFFRVGDHEGH